MHKKSEMDMFRHMIDQEYRVHWLLDGLPVAVRSEDGDFVTRGYPVGFVASIATSKRTQHYLFNHVRIVVKWFEVIPFSIKVRCNIYIYLMINIFISFLDDHK